MVRELSISFHYSAFGYDVVMLLTIIFNGQSEYIPDVSRGSANVCPGLRLKGWQAK